MGEKCNEAAPKNLGIIYADESGKGLSHPFFVLILDSFREEAAAHGYNITFINHRIINKSGILLPYCRSSTLNGICMVCVKCELPEIQELAASEIPCVTIDHMYRRVPAVLSDNETGVRKLVEYAISCGHERIAFIHGHNNSIVTRTRIQQFRSVMDYHGLPVSAGYLREGLYSDIGLTRRLVKELLLLPDRPTCILLPDDISYLGAQDAARELGLRIPEDISFAGYDCIPITQSLTPRLTTIRQNTSKMGKIAAQLLIEQIENPDTVRPTPRIFPVELVEGGTMYNLK